MANIGNLVAKITLDAGGVKTGAQQAIASVRNLGSVLPMIGIGLSAWKIKSVFDDIRTEMDSLAKFARASGLSVRELGQLGYAAELSGVQMDKLQDGLKDMVTRLGEVRSESRVAAGDLAGLASGPGKGFALLGIDPRGMGNLEAFTAIADAMQRTDDAALRAAAGNAIFSDNWRTLMPLLLQGGDAIEEVMAKAERLGITMSDSQAAKLERYNDALATLKMRAKGVAIELVNNLMPAVEGVAAAMEGGVDRTIPGTDEKDMRGSITRYLDLWTGGVMAIKAGLEGLAVNVGLGDLIGKDMNQVYSLMDAASDLATGRTYAEENAALEKQKQAVDSVTESLKAKDDAAKRASSSLLSSLTEIEKTLGGVSEDVFPAMLGDSFADGLKAVLGGLRDTGLEFSDDLERAFDRIGLDDTERMMLDLAEAIGIDLADATDETRAKLERMLGILDDAGKAAKNLAEQQRQLDRDKQDAAALIERFEPPEAQWARFEERLERLRSLDEGITDEIADAAREDARKRIFGADAGPDAPQSMAAPQALVRGTAAEYNATVAQRSPSEQRMLTLAEAAAARDDIRNKALDKIAQNSGKTRTATLPR